MNTAAFRDEWVGRVIDGRFTLRQWLGGTVGTGVYLTELEGDPPRKAAIKLIPSDAAGAETRIAGWAATAGLSHPHLMRLFHSGRCEIDNVALLYSVTEYADEVLAEIIPRRPLTPREAGEMLAPVTDALSYLHGTGFVHGHLKPSNILVVDDRLKLSADCIHVAGERNRHAAERSVYYAPEGLAPISPATDIWSLGVTLVEAMTQHPPPWDRSKQRDPLVPEFIPQPFADIARECLRSAPARRCTIGDVKAHLESGRSLPVVEIDKKPSAKLRVAVLIAAALVVLAVFAVLQLRSPRARPSPPASAKPTQPAVATAPPQSPAPLQSTAPAQPAASPQSAAESQVPVPETHPSGRLTAKGEVAERVLPDVPQKAIDTIQGKLDVAIRVDVDPGGNVSNATIESQGPSKYFANLALEASRRWKFKPTQAEGQAVSSVWILRFRFRQTGIEVAPVETSP